jgi:DNA-binding IclR family transcriptional regulator
VERLGWSKPAAYRLLRTLEMVGAVRQQEGKGYVLGPMMVALGQAALRESGLMDVAKPHLRRLFEELRETIVLTVLDGDEVVYLDRIEADELLVPRARLGSRLPAYCTSTGQVLLAGLSDDEVRTRLAAREFISRAPNTLTSLDAVLARLHEVRRRGFAINDEELTLGHRAAAAPVVNQLDEVVAAISLSVPTARVSKSQLLRHASEHVVPAARAISRALGAP